jgi:hypothetical protein
MNGLCRPTGSRRQQREGHDDAEIKVHSTLTLRFPVSYGQTASRELVNLPLRAATRDVEIERTGAYQHPPITLERRQTGGRDAG